MERLSIIIVTYNSADVIRPCIRSIREQLTEGIAAEIIAVDNASVDGTQEILRDELRGGVILLNSVNCGFAAAVNQALGKTSGDIVLLMNPDVVIEGLFFTNLLKFFGDHPEGCLAGPLVMDITGNRQPSCWRAPSLGTVALECFLPHSWSMPMVTLRPDATCEVEMVSGVCLAMRRRVYEALGGLDERFFMFYEDADYCRRARSRGFKVFFVAEVGLRHRVSSSAARNFPEFLRWIYRSRLQFIAKYHGPRYVLSARLVCFVGVCLKIPAYFVFGVTSGRKDLFSLARSHVSAIPEIFGSLK